MVKRKRLAKNILVFALALSMVFTSVTPTMTVNAEGETTVVTSSDEQGEVISDGEAEETSTVAVTEGQTQDEDDSADTTENGESEDSGEADPNGSTDDSDTADGGSDSSSIDSADETALEDGEADSEDEGADPDADGTEEDAIAVNLTSVNNSGISLASDEGETASTLGSEYNLKNGAVVIKSDGMYNEESEKVAEASDGGYTITGEYTGTETAAITVDSKVEVTLILSGVDITVTGASGSHRAGIWIKDGANVTLSLKNTNNITGEVVDPTGEKISTGVIGIYIGGTPSDSSKSNGGTSLLIEGEGSLNISEVGTGIALTHQNSLTINGTSLNINGIYMMDTTISGMGIYSNGELIIENGAKLKISGVNTDNLSGTQINYNSAYGIDSQQGGTITITGAETVVDIIDCYQAGIYSSHTATAGEDGSTMYSGNTITVSDNAALNISVESSELTSSSGIRMENHGSIDVLSNASLNVTGFTHWGITIGYEGNINVSGSGSAINLVGTSGVHTNSTVGIYAERDVRIDINDSAEVNIDNVTGRGIDFEKGTSGTDGVYVSNGTLNITNAGAGIYVMGGTTSIEFTDGAVVSMDVTGNCIGSDNKGPVTGHILMSGSKTNVDFNTTSAAISCNFKYLKIADYADVYIETTSEGIGMGDSVNGGTKIIVTSNANFSLESNAGNGIVTYFSDHYIEVSDGATMTLSGDGGTGIVVSSDNTQIYVSDATLNITNTNGIVVSSTGNLLYEDSNSHIEASNVYAAADGGSMDFIVMGGTLTYDFNHQNNVWPYNATNIVIGDFAEDAFEVNEKNVARSIAYLKSEALVNFIVPSDESHLSFKACYNENNSFTKYNYLSDGEKEGSTLSVWVPGVEMYYNFDEDTSLTDTDLTGEYVNELESQGVEFVRQYESTVEPYDMVIRGHGIEFSASEVSDNEITLTYARQKNGEVIDHALNGTSIIALYTTDYTAEDGTEYEIQWYYGSTDFSSSDAVTDDGPLGVFETTSVVTRGLVANAYGILGTPSEDEETDNGQSDVSKSKSATQLDENYESVVTLSLPSDQIQLMTDVVFVLDKSTSVETSEAIVNDVFDALVEQVEKTGASVRVGVVVFNKEANIACELKDLAENYDEIADAVYVTDEAGKSKYGSGTNMHAGLLAGEAMLDADDKVDDSMKYLILVSDGITYIYNEEPTSISTTAYEANAGNVKTNTVDTMDAWAMKYVQGSNIADVMSDYYGYDSSSYSTVELFDRFLSIVGKWVQSDGDTYDHTYGGEATVTLASHTNSGKDILGSLIDQAAEVGYSESDSVTLHANNIEKALYLSATEYQNISSKYTCFAIENGVEKNYALYPWGAEFMEYLADGEEYDFSQITDEIIYLLGPGSQVVDVIGYGTDNAGNDYDFEFVDSADKINLQVGDAVYKTVEAETEGAYETSRYQFIYEGVSAENEANAPFVLIYYANGQDGNSDECFVWEINISVSNFEKVQLKYMVKLTNPQTNAGTYGTYDEYGENGYSELYTNQSATLYPVDSEGNEGDPEDFNKPTVSYEVISETPTETEDPGDPADTETTETVVEDPADPQEAESTVVAEVVSAVTGDNAPIGIAILLAAISEIALITLIVLQMRKKKDEVI